MGTNAIGMADVGPWDEGVRAVPDPFGGDPDWLALIGSEGWTVYHPGHCLRIFASGPETGAEGRALADVALARMFSEGGCDVTANAAPDPEGPGVVAAQHLALCVPADAPTDDSRWVLRASEEAPAGGEILAASIYNVDVADWIVDAFNDRAVRAGDVGGRIDQRRQCRPRLVALLPEPPDRARHIGAVLPAVGHRRARCGERLQHRGLVLGEVVPLRPRLVALAEGGCEGVYVLACETDQIGPDYDRSENLLGTLSNAIDLARSGGPL